MPYRPLLPVLAALALGLGASACRADEDTAPAPEHREFWLTTGFLSHHTAHTTHYHYNEHNDGIGMEWRTSYAWQFNAGHYRNSVRHDSTYVQAAWMPWQQPVDLLGEDARLRAGGSVGLINGYPKVRHGKVFATLVPALSLETRRVGLNLVYIPSLGKRVDGAFALQAKLRLD